MTARAAACANATADGHRSVPHNVFFTPQAGAPADIAGNNTNVSITRTFAAAGTYAYTCHIHPSMHGTVEVR